MFSHIQEVICDTSILFSWSDQGVSWCDYRTRINNLSQSKIVNLWVWHWESSLFWKAIIRIDRGTRDAGGWINIWEKSVAYDTIFCPVICNRIVTPRLVMSEFCADILRSEKKISFACPSHLFLNMVLVDKIDKACWILEPSTSMRTYDKNVLKRISHGMKGKLMIAWEPGLTVTDCQMSYCTGDV